MYSTLNQRKLNEIIKPICQIYILLQLKNQIIFKCYRDLLTIHCKNFSVGHPIVVCVDWYLQYITIILLMYYNLRVTP